MQRLRKLVPVLILLVGLGLVLAFDLDDWLSIDALREHRAVLLEFTTSRPVLSAAVFCGVYALATAVSAPGGALLTLTGGFLFGAVAGTVFSVTGATIGATLVFLAARTAFADLLRARAGSTIERMREGFSRNALSYLLFLRLIPVFPFFVVNLVPAFLGVKLRTYVIATFIGIIPGGFVYALIGSGLGEIFDRNEPFTVASVLDGTIIAGLVGLAIMALLPVLHQKLRRK